MQTPQLDTLQSIELAEGVIVHLHPAGPIPRAMALIIDMIIAALIIGALISFSRVWLGVHYPSDVLAGWLGGVGWVLGCWALVWRIKAPARLR